MLGMENKRTMPFFRWAGSKRQILPRLRLFWNNKFSRYIEPFAGSACLFFALQPQKAIIADINKDLIDTYRVIQSSPRAVYLSLSKIPQDKSTFLEMRSLKVNNLNPLEKATRFLYLNRLCFNGLYRTNSKGEFNVPYNNLDGRRFPPWGNFKESSSLLKKAILLHADFQQVIKKVKENDFVYLDPPYAIQKRKIFTEYGVVGFTTEDLPRLVIALKAIHERGAKFVLSYAFCSEAINVFEKWKTRKIRLRRNIAGFARFRRCSYELIVSNMSIPAIL